MKVKKHAMKSEKNIITTAFISFIYFCGSLFAGDPSVLSCEQLSTINNSAFIRVGAASVNKNCQAVAVWSEELAPPAIIVGSVFNDKAWSPSATQVSTENGLDTSRFVLNPVYQSPLAVDIDSNGNAFATWIHFSNNSIYGASYNSTAQSWGSPVLVTDQSGVRNNTDAYLWVVVDDEKKAHVIRTATAEESVIYSGSNDCGATWPSSLVRQLSPQGVVTFAAETFFAVSDDKKSMIVVWGAVDGIFPKHLQAAIYTNGNWNVPSANEFIDSVTLGDSSFISMRGVDINNRGQAILLYAQEDVGTSSKGILKGAFYDNGWRGLVTLLEEASSDAIGEGATSLNNNGVGISVIRSVNASAHSWSTINFNWVPVDASSLSTIGSSINIVLCSNDRGDGALVTTSLSTSSSKIAHFDFENKKWDSLLPAGCVSNSDLLAQGCIKGFSSGVLMSRDLHLLVHCGTAIPLSINPPTNLRGRCALNRFASQSERFAMIEWGASITNNEVQYAIFRDDVLLGVVPAAQKTFVEHNLTPGKKVYGVRAISATGDISAETTVPLACS